jgi:HK97 family phage major capsid protein/HK97 family phage prohead protease
MKLTPQTRFLKAAPDAVAVDREARTVTFPFSSEEGVDRAFGREVLSHERGAARLDRLNDGAPLLFNHNMDDVIGVVESARISDKRGHATVRFAKTTRADEVLGMVEDGVLRNVSFMYRIHEYEQAPKSDEFRVTDWEPLEVSIVTVPADHTVGIGRAFGTEEIEARNVASEPAAPAAVTPGVKMSEVNNAVAGATAEPSHTAAQYEQARVRAIEFFCKANKVDERAKQHYIASGASVEKVGEEILALTEARAKAAGPLTQIGMSTNEAKRFSIWKAIQAVSSGDWTDAGFELEASRAVAEKTGKTARRNSFFVPMEVQKRDASVGGTGGYLVATDNVSFVELLRNRMVVKQMGATTLSGLVGNVTIPKQTAGATAYWLASETTQITEGNQTFGQLALSPKTVGAYTEVSRLLQLQSSPDIDGLVMMDLAKQVAIAADLAALNGSGSAGQPAGLIGTSGAGAVSMGTFDFADILNFQEDVAAANALQGALGYVTTPAVASLCMQRVKYTSTASPIWEGNLSEGTVVGFKAMSSNQIPSGDMIFGDWSQLVIGEWGVLELAVDDKANFQAGISGIRCFYTMDVGVRIPAAFSIGTSAS